MCQKCYVKRTKAGKTKGCETDDRPRRGRPPKTPNEKKERKANEEGDRVDSRRVHVIDAQKEAMETLTGPMHLYDQSNPSGRPKKNQKKEQSSDAIPDLDAEDDLSGKPQTLGNGPVLLASATAPVAKRPSSDIDRELAAPKSARLMQAAPKSPRMQPEREPPKADKGTRPASLPPGEKTKDVESMHMNSEHAEEEGASEEKRDGHQVPHRTSPLGYNLSSEEQAEKRPKRGRPPKNQTRGEQVDG